MALPTASIVDERLFTLLAQPRIVAGDIQPAEAVHIPVEVGDVAGAQGHVGATEQQPALVEQGGRVQSQVAAAAQGAVVVQARGAGHEVAGGGDPPTVDQQVAGAERDIGAAGEAGGVAEVELAAFRAKSPRLVARPLPR